jgi:hypothetical protein
MPNDGHVRLERSDNPNHGLVSAGSFLSVAVPWLIFTCYMRLSPGIAG